MYRRSFFQTRRYGQTWAFPSEHLGPNWAYRFINRHPEMWTKRCRNLDQERSDAEKTEIIEGWFRLFTSKSRFDV